MEKTMGFAVFKEKIIKTNELLQLHLAKTKELDKMQKCYLQLKTRMELCKDEIKKFKLKNDALSYNLQITEKSYTTLKEEHSKLKLQFSELERESNKTINGLQINYQLANQELKECQEKLCRGDDEEEPLVVKQKPKSPVKRKSAVKPVNDGRVMNHKITELMADKEKLLSENGNLKLEMYELKKKLKELRCFEMDLAQMKQAENELSIKQQELADLQMKFKISNEKKEQKINNIETARNRLEKENEKLRNENCSYKIEISVLQQSEDKHTTEKINKIEKANKLLLGENGKLKEVINGNQLEISTLLVKIKEYNNIPSDEEIAEIMNEITPPMRLSPLNHLEEDVSVDHNKVPPYIEEKEHRPLLEFNERPITSPSSQSTSNSSDTIKFRNRRPCVRKKNKIIKKKRRNIDLLGALKALKRANINFFISNDSIIQSNGIGSCVIKTPRPAYAEPKSAVEPEKKHSHTFISNLNCALTCCKNYHMLLKDGEDEDAPLLGFFDVKDEVVPRPENRIDKDSSNVCWTEAVSFHRSVKKRKKPEYINSKTLDDSNIELELDESCNQKTREDIALSKTCDTTARLRSKKKINSVISNKKQVQHSYGTRNLSRRLNLDGKNSCSEVITASPVKAIACINRPSLDSEKSCEASPVKKIASATSQLKPVTREKSPRTTFKRPICRTRRSPRLVASKAQSEVGEVLEVSSEEVPVSVPSSCPQSPVPSNEACVVNKPTLIPLERTQGSGEKMATSKIEMLFEKLINYSMEEEALNEVVHEFSNQDPTYIAQAILEKISKDYHDSPDSKHSPAPLMTETQRTMLGFMSKLEKTNIIGVFDSYLTLAEHRLLTCALLQEISPITRLYLAICKLHKNLHRMRKLCCDVFYFCGDFAVPFLFVVLTSWSEVLPLAADSEGQPLARILVQIVYMKECNKPGYNLMPLRDLLIKFYGYPTERWDSDQFFLDLFHGYLRNPVRSSDFSLLLFCKNHPEKWVNDKIEAHLKPIVDQIPAENFKAAVIILIGNLYNRFSSKSEVNYLTGVRKWLTNLVNETTPDVVKRSVYLCLSRLKKK